MKPSDKSAIICHIFVAAMVIAPTFRQAVIVGALALLWLVLYIIAEIAGR